VTYFLVAYISLILIASGVGLVMWPAPVRTYFPPEPFNCRKVVGALAEKAEQSGYAAYVDNHRRLVITHCPDLIDPWCTEHQAHRAYHPTLVEAADYLERRLSAEHPSPRSIQSRLRR